MNNHFQEPDQPMQSIDQVMQIVLEATIPGARGPNQYLMNSTDLEDDDMDVDDYESDVDLSDLDE